MKFRVWGSGKGKVSPVFSPPLSRYIAYCPPASLSWRGPWRCSSQSASPITRATSERVGVGAQDNGETTLPNRGGAHRAKPTLLLVRTNAKKKENESSIDQGERRAFPGDPGHSPDRREYNATRGHETQKKCNRGAHKRFSGNALVFARPARRVHPVS